MYVCISYIDKLMLKEEILGKQFHIHMLYKIICAKYLLHVNVHTNAYI